MHRKSIENPPKIEVWVFKVGISYAFPVHVVVRFQYHVENVYKCNNRTVKALYVLVVLSKTKRSRNYLAYNMPLSLDSFRVSRLNARGAENSKAALFVAMFQRRCNNHD